MSERRMTPEEKKRAARWVLLLWIVNVGFGGYLIVKGAVLGGGAGPIVLGAVMALVGLFFIFGMPRR